MMKTDLYAKSDKMQEILGAEELLTELEMALDSDTLQEMLEYIDRCYDLGVFEDKEED